tara:strand:- start:93 stop:419 length:327 start_codon:yes stop_codon:yes gene_type:complete
MLEVFFQDARAMPPRMPAGLMDRALAGALGAQPEPASQGWRGLWRGFGGAPALGGVVTATAVGFWLGVSVPGLLPDLAAQIIIGDTFAAADDIRAPELTAFGWDIDGG